MPRLFRRALLAPVLLLALACAQSARAQLYTFQVAHTFRATDSNGDNTDGVYPYANLTLGPDGTLYGTTSGGGLYSGGTLFSYKNGTLTTLYNFGAHASDGYIVGNGVALGPDGTLYGVTGLGGNLSVNNGHGDGTLFAFKNGVLTTLADFNGSNGAQVSAKLALAPDGTLYGVASQGGDMSVLSSGEGTLFAYKNGVLTVLVAFNFNTNGADTPTSVILAPDGTLYGTTNSGGIHDGGVLFSYSNSAFTILHNFGTQVNGVNVDGKGPMGVTIGPDGTFYGATSVGGSGGSGTLYSYKNGTVTTLYNFSPLNSQYVNSDGYGPRSAPVLAPDGTLFGSAYEGGVHGDGTVFSYRNGTFTVLHTFGGSSDGSDPNGGVTLTSDGSLYGCAIEGGAHGNGTLFALTPSRFDFNGDGHNDLLWHNTQTGQALVWDMNDQTTLAAGSPFATVSPQWTIAAVADINNDGHPDLLWENTQTGQLLFWLMGGTNGSQVLGYGPVFATVSDTHWHVVSMSDFNGDGKPDLLWENSATGQLTVWYMNGGQIASYGQVFATVTDTHWSVAGTADFNDDGKPDLLWRNSQSGQVLVWNMTGAQGTTVLSYGATLATLADPTWHIVGTGDTNGDGHPDIVWQNSSTGQVLRWLLGGTNGETVTQYGNAFATVAETHWQIVGVH